MSASKAYLGRQPILDTQQRIVAYELLYRQDTHNLAQFSDPSLATASVLVNTFTTLGVNQVLGSKLGYINFGRQLLEQDLVYLLPPKQIVLEILEDIEPDADFIQRCMHLKQQGYRFALDDFVYHPHLEPLLDVAEILKLDILLLDETRIREHRSLAQKHGMAALAEKVENREQFAFCQSLQFDLYQGGHFAQPVILEQRDIPTFRLRIMEIMNLLISGAEYPQIEAVISRDMALSYKLLRYINSAGLRRAEKIDSIHHALVGLGQQQLYRWLSLLLFADKGEAPSSALMSTALARGRLIELLGRQAFRDTNDLFVFGMFSFLDALLHMPMEHILRDMRLPDNIRMALLERSGPYAPFLALAEAIERFDWIEIQRLVSELQLDEQTVNHAQFEALSYSEIFLN